MLVAFAGCQTTSPDAEPNPFPGRNTAAFRPLDWTVPLSTLSGAYPGLFGGQTRATILRPGGIEGLPVELRSMAEGLAQQSLVVALELESTFEDMAIAYNAVGLRAVAPVLELPDGRRIAPLQVVVGPELDATPVGSLRTFRRTNLIAFPVALEAIEVPVVEAGAPPLRLELDMLDSVFAFEWYARVEFTSRDQRKAERRAIGRMIKSGALGVHQVADEVGNNFH